MTIGAELIQAERKRQIEVEGWTAEHDEMHEPGELENAAYCYFKANGPDEDPDGTGQPMGTWWPWDISWWKPKDRLSNLIRAGALYQAAADRAERAGNKHLMDGDLAHVRDIAKMIDEFQETLGDQHV